MVGISPYDQHISTLSLSSKKMIILSERISKEQQLLSNGNDSIPFPLSQLLSLMFGKEAATQTESDKEKDGENFKLMGLLVYQLPKSFFLSSFLGLDPLREKVVNVLKSDNFLLCENSKKNEVLMIRMHDHEEQTGAQSFCLQLECYFFLCQTDGQSHDDVAEDCDREESTSLEIFVKFLFSILKFPRKKKIQIIF